MSTKYNIMSTFYGIIQFIKGHNHEKLGKLGYETEQDIETDDEDNENWKTIPTNKRTKKRPTHIKKK